MGDPLQGGDDERHETEPDRLDWRREHAVDHADFLDALLDPDDPLHEIAKRALADDSPEERGTAT